MYCGKCGTLLNENQKECKKCMKKIVTSKKLTINYIISFILWSFLAGLTLVPISEVIIENITFSLLGFTETNFDNLTSKLYISVIIIAFISIIFSTLIDYCVNIIATNSAMSKVENIDEEKSNRFINNVSIFYIIMWVCNLLLNIYLNQLNWIIFIINIISTLISLFIIRKYIRKQITRIIRRS